MAVCMNLVLLYIKLVSEGLGFFIGRPPSISVRPKNGLTLLAKLLKIRVKTALIEFWTKIYAFFEKSEIVTHQL